MRRGKKSDRLVRGTYRNDAAERWFWRFRRSQDSYALLCQHYEELVLDHQCVLVIVLDAIENGTVECSCGGSNKNLDCDLCELKRYYKESVKTHGRLHS